MTERDISQFESINLDEAANLVRELAVTERKEHGRSVLMDRYWLGKPIGGFLQIDCVEFRIKEEAVDQDHPDKDPTYYSITTYMAGGIAHLEFHVSYVYDEIWVQDVNNGLELSNLTNTPMVKRFINELKEAKAKAELTWDGPAPEVIEGSLSATMLKELEGLKGRLSLEEGKSYKIEPRDESVGKIIVSYDEEPHISIETNIIEYPELSTDTSTIRSYDDYWIYFDPNGCININSCKKLERADKGGNYFDKIDYDSMNLIFRPDEAMPTAISELIAKVRKELTTATNTEVIG